MTQHIAMLIEASSIQDYIFGSNELVQNIGASELAAQATTDWLFEEKSGLLPKPHNVRRAGAGEAARWQLTDQSLADNLTVEVVYAGGGNALILFHTEEVARKVSYELTRKVLQDAPGLRLELAWQPFAPNRLSATVNRLREQIAGQKRGPRHSAPLSGLGVTAACAFTDAPAVARDKDDRYISAEVAAKQRAGTPDGPGNERLRDYLADVRRFNFDFVYDFDQFGAKGESSYMAVVHTDGNRMGERIQTYADRHAENDAAYVRAQREFSTRVQAAAHAALVSTVGLLLAPANLKLDNEAKGKYWRYKIGQTVPVRIDADGVERLPFRPVVFGGDDVTFVCEGRLGLPLAAHYLSRLAQETLPDDQPLHARAGVAIVKSHYPFARAYALADELCDSAKTYIREADRQMCRVTALDWHFAVSGLVQPLTQLRRREYIVGAGSLLMRPLRVTPIDPTEWRSWDVFSEILEEFASGREWAGRRNKVKALRESLRAGPDAVQLFLQNMPDSPRLPLPEALTSAGDAVRRGWQGSRCLYFDAVEAVDFHVPLKEV